MKTQTRIKTKIKKNMINKNMRTTIKKSSQCNLNLKRKFNPSRKIKKNPKKNKNQNKRKKRLKRMNLTLRNFKRKI